MTWFSLAEHSAAMGFVLVCWVLAHQNAVAREPFARTISAGYGLTGLFALGAMLFRAVPDLADVVPVSALAARIALVGTLVAVAIRLRLIHPPE